METIEVTKVCVDNLPELVGVIGGGVVVAASTLANVLGKGSLIGKIVNWLALNFTVAKVKKEK